MAAASDLAPRDPARSRIARLIAWSVSNRVAVAALAAALAVAGYFAARSVPLDAIPDLTDTQVIIRADFPGQSPQIVEDAVTYPLSASLLGLPGARAVRGASMFGTSFVYVIFEDGVDLYWARSRVAEALTRLRGVLPDGVAPLIGPDATGVGWVYQYALVDRTGAVDLAELRALQDWFVKLELAGVAGVAEVASVGGFVREYQVLVDPNRLRAFDVHITRVAEAVRAASAEVGGRVIEQSESEFMLRAAGYVESVADLERAVVIAADGTPVTLADVARVVEGPALRRGIVEFDGQGEAVAGVVVMRDGENALRVIDRVKRRLAELARGLPEGVEIVAVYDRAPLIEGAVGYLRDKLLEEAAAVALVTMLFLLSARAALVALATLPLGILGAFLVMSAQGVAANIMSLGGIAIAIGTMVDASIVLVENAMRRLAALGADADAAARRRVLVAAAQEVGPGIFFSLLVVTVSFLPVFALAGESLRLFAPLAFTKTYAMAWAALLSVTLVPVLMLWLLRTPAALARGGGQRLRRWMPRGGWIMRAYRPVVAWALRRRRAVLALALAALATTLWPLWKLGAEFMPPLYEAELLYMPSTLPGASATKMRELLGQTNRLIRAVPEVEAVFGKAGRADTATDPAPLTMIETWIRLKPRADWRPGLTIEALIAELDAQVAIPGLTNSWGYPIKTRMDMVSTGVRTPVGVKITGDSLAGIERLALAVEAAVARVPGARAAFADRVLGGRYLEIVPDRSALARHEIDMGVFQSVVRMALGGAKLAQSVQGRERYDIIMRYDRAFRETPEDLGGILVPSPSGAHVPLAELARVSYAEGPPMIRSENARLAGWVFVDVAGRDISGFVAEACDAVARSVDLPSGYAIEWAGQHEQLAQANARLAIAVPATLGIVLLLLLAHFGRLDRALLALAAVPFGLIGGFWSVYLAGYHLSVAVAVGCIALGGLAVETAVVMLLYIDGAVRERAPDTRRALAQAIVAGATLRVRPILMTALTVAAGLAPIFLTDGLGADVMRRIALPMLGGVATTLALTLIALPALYALWVGRRLPERA